jgi:pimeloyl-ACP methyl ester carboxylesterase
MTIALTRSFALTIEDGTTLRYQTIGSGEGLILVGDATLTARDYLPLARILALSHTVHVLERRGHGASSPQGPGYSMETECRDLLAFQRHTRASLVFGHGYGGLIALETARHQNVFRKITVYDPGLSIGGSVPLGWLPEYRQRLAAGDPRGAFACLVSQGGYAPGPLTAMPFWCPRAFPRLFLSGRRWPEMEPLLPAILAEHEQIARLDDGTADRYAAIAVPVMLLGGRTSPAFSAAGIDILHRVIPGSVLEIVDGLGHDAPVRKPPLTVAQCLLRFLRRPSAVTATARASRDSGLPVDQAQFPPPGDRLGAVAGAQLA